MSVDRVGSMSSNTDINNHTTPLSPNEGKRLVAAKIANVLGQGECGPLRIINAFLQVKDHEGLGKYLSKHQIPASTLTTVLQRACISSDPDAVRVLASGGANVNHVDQFGTTMLHFAMRGGGNEAVLTALVKNGLDYSGWSNEGMPLLHWACSMGLLDLVKSIIEQNNASLQEPDEVGRLPIHVAAVFGRAAVLTYLIPVLSRSLCPSNVPSKYSAALDKDLDSDEEEEGSRITAVADETRRKGNVRIRVKINADRHPSGAVRKRKRSMINLKIVAAANYWDMHNWTPLHHASCEEAINCYADCLKLLLDNGADPMLPTRQGKTTLDLAYAAGRSQVLVDVLPDRQLIALLMRIDDIIPFHIRRSQYQKQQQQEQMSFPRLRSANFGSNLIVPTEQPQLGSTRDLVPSVDRQRKGYSFIRKLAENMSDSTIPGFDNLDVGSNDESMVRASCQATGSGNKPSDSTTLNTVTIWRKILLNDNVELLLALRDSQIWREQKVAGMSGTGGAGSSFRIGGGGGGNFFTAATEATDFSALANDLPHLQDQTLLNDFETGQNLTVKHLAELFFDCYENGTGVYSHIHSTYQHLIKAHDFLTVLQDLTGLTGFEPLLTNKVVIFTPIYRSILFLALICGRFRISEQLLRMRQFDVLPTTVLVTLILRRLRKEPSFPHQVVNELWNFTERIEAIAVDVLNLVYLKDNTPEKMICRDMLCVALRSFGKIPLLDLCARAKCTYMLSLPCCQRILDERWHGVLIFLPPSLRIPSKLMPCIALAYLEYVNRREKRLMAAPQCRLSPPLSGSEVGFAVLVGSPGTNNKQRPVNVSVPSRFPSPSPHQRYKSACKLQHNQQSLTEKAPIYTRMSNQYYWSSSPRLRFMLGFFHSPSVKFLFHTIFHLFFLLIFSIVCVLELHCEYNAYEMTALAYILGYALEELRHLAIDYLHDEFHEYFKDGWNWIDMLAIAFSGSGFLARQFCINNPIDAYDSKLYITRNLYMVGLNLFYIRTLYMTSISPIIGPRLKMMADMLKKDLLPLAVVFIIFIFSFGVWFQGLIYPNGYGKLENNTAREDKRMNITDAFALLFRRSFYSIFEVSVVLDEGECESPGKPCGYARGYNAVIYAVLVIYILIVNLILMNLLIALFSNTVSRIDQKSTALWLAGRYKMVEEYRRRSIFPPPLNLLNLLYEIGACCVTCCCRSGSSAQNQWKLPHRRYQGNRYRPNINAISGEEVNIDDMEASRGDGKFNPSMSNNQYGIAGGLTTNEADDRNMHAMLADLQRRSMNLRRSKTTRIRKLLRGVTTSLRLEVGEIDNVLKFILLQSFALQDRRQALGSGASAIQPNTITTNSNNNTGQPMLSRLSSHTTGSDELDLLQPSSSTVKTHEDVSTAALLCQLELRFNKLESMMSSLMTKLDEPSPTRLDVKPQPSPSDSIANRSPVPLRMPKCWSIDHEMSKDLSSQPLDKDSRIPSSSEMLANIEAKSSFSRLSRPSLPPLSLPINNEDSTRKKKASRSTSLAGGER